jgi:hypothetical protein
VKKDAARQTMKDKTAFDAQPGQGLQQAAMQRGKPGSGPQKKP